MRTIDQKLALFYNLSFLIRDIQIFEKLKVHQHRQKHPTSKFLSIGI